MVRARKSWRYADAFQRSIISEAIYHLPFNSRFHAHDIFRKLGRRPRKNAPLREMHFNADFVWLINNIAIYLQNIIDISS